MHKKILIIGAPTSGKTTLAQYLSKKWEIKHIEVDQFLWTDKKGGPIRESFLEDLKQELNEENWVIEGQLNRAFPLIEKKLNGFIYLNTPLWILWSRGFIRFMKKPNLKELIMNFNPSSFRKRRKFRQKLLNTKIPEIFLEGL